MTAQEYVKNILAQHDIDWLQMHGNEELAIVEFIEHPVKMLSQLEELGKGVFSEVRMVACTGRKCTFAIRPGAVEPTLSEAFAELARSTAAFHERFETDKHIGLREQWWRVHEEYHEAGTEVGWLLDGEPHQSELVHELADMFVAMLGVLHFAGVSESDFASALLEVAAKNDRKTLDNCVWHNGKVTRREKLEKGNG